MSDPYAFLKQRDTSPFKGLENIMLAFMSGPSPLDRQKFELDRQNMESQMDYRRALMGQAATAAELNRQKLNAPKQIADIFGTYGNMNPLGDDVGPPRPQEAIRRNVQQSMPDLASALAATGDLDKLGATIRPYLSLYGDDNDMRRSQAAAGSPLSETQERALAFRDLAPNMRSIAVGPTETETKGSELAALFAQPGGLSRPERMAVLGAEPAAPPKGVNVRLPDGTMGISFDGGRTVNGQAAPDGSLIMGVNVEDTADGMSGFGTAPANKIQTQLIGLQKAGQTLTRYRQLMEGMSGDDFGILGNLRAMGQDVADQFEGIANVALQKADSPEVAEKITALTNQIFDPRLPNKEVLRSMLIADLATRFSGGGRIAAHHLERAESIVGTNWSGKRTVGAKLDEIQRSLEAEYQAYRRMTKEGLESFTPTLFEGAPVEAQSPTGSITDTIGGFVKDLTKVPVGQATQKKQRIRFDAQGNIIE